MSTTIRVSEKTRDRFVKLASATGKPMVTLLEDAADALERQIFFKEFSERYAQLREDPDAWAEIEQERHSESAVVRDSSK